MGADAFVTTGEDEVARVQAALGGPPDVVFECAGVPGMLAKSIEHVRRKGTRLRCAGIRATSRNMPSGSLLGGK